MDERDTDSNRAPTDVVRHEEEIAGVDKRWEGVGYVRAHKRVESVRAQEDVERNREEVALERVPAEDGDSGKVETLADGSISIPVFEEELVVTKRTVLRERVVIRKHVVTEQQRVRAQLKKERVTFDADDGAELTGAVARPSAGYGGRATHVSSPGETRPFLVTSEFAAAVLAVAALVITGATDALNATQTVTLVVVIVCGYAISRGLAKSRTPSHAWDPREWRRDA